MASVASQPPSIIVRVDRLDLILGYLEEMRSSCSTPRSPAGTSTTAFSGPLVASNGGDSSVTSSPRSLSWRRCHPMKEVVVEAQAKGRLMDRIDLLESRVLKMEEEMEIGVERSPSSGDKKPRKKGLKQLVKSCVRGDLKNKE